MGKRNFYMGKSSLLRMDADQIKGSIGPGHQLTIPSGITSVVVIRKRAKPFKAEDHQKKDDGWQGADGLKPQVARNGGRNHRPEHSRKYLQQKNRAGRKTDVEHIKSLNGTLDKPRKGPLVKHARKAQHLDWSVL